MERSDKKMHPNVNDLMNWNEISVLGVKRKR